MTGPIKQRLNRLSLMDYVITFMFSRTTKTLNNYLSDLVFAVGVNFYVCHADSYTRTEYILHVLPFKGQ